MPLATTRIHFLVLLMLSAILKSGLADEMDQPESTEVQEPKTFNFSSTLQKICQSRNPQAALLDLRSLRAKKSLTQDQVSEIEGKILFFDKHLQNGMVKLGSKWVKQEEALAAAKKEEDLISKAYEKLKKGNGKETLNLLTKAYKENPNGIRARFILGMLFSIRGNSNPFIADDHFAAVVRIEPSYVPALNNLAVCEIKARKYSDALKHFKQAIALAPEAPEILHNLIRVVSEVRNNQLPMPKSSTQGGNIFSKFDALYEEVKAAEKVEKLKSNPERYWLFMPYVGTDLEKTSSDRQQPDSTASKSGSQLVTISSSGSGFAVAPDKIVTNRHVVRHNVCGVASSVTISQPGSTHQNPIPAKIFAISDQDDLAILHVERLQLPQIKFSEKRIKRSMEVLVLGYPLPGKLGDSLKATQGVIASDDRLHFAGLEEMLMLDAEANPGNSGGPVCDRSGGLVGVLTARTFNQEVNGDYSFAVSRDKLAAFLEQSQIAFAQNEQQNDSTDWSEVDERLSPSIFMVNVSHMSSPLKFRELLPEKIRPANSEFHDDSCCNCNGRGLVPCRAVGCALGAKIGTQIYTQTINLGTSQVQVSSSNQVNYKCENCNGRGHVNCPACRGTGVDSK